MSVSITRILYIDRTRIGDSNGTGEIWSWENVMKQVMFTLWLVNVLMANPLFADVGELAFSFSENASGGVAVARIDRITGKLLDSQKLFDERDCRQPLKVRRVGEYGDLVVTNLDKKGPHLFVVDRLRRQTRRILLSAVPDELRIFGDKGFVTCDQDVLAVVNLQTAQIVSEWDVSDSFDPPANAPEDVYITQDQHYAVVSFQKDSRRGTKQGSRLAIYRLPEADRIADLQLPRDHPELHIHGNLKEQGPSPEVIYVSPETNTLLVTLDLYGAVGVMDWGDARLGKRVHWEIISTAISGELGTAFPDRGCAVKMAGEDCFLVCNAGKPGGSALIGLNQRKALWKATTPPGLESPVFFPDLKKAYSVCSGKTKARRGGQIEKEYFPRKSLYIFDFSSPESLLSKTVQEIQFDDFVQRIAKVKSARPLLLLALGPRPEGATQLAMFDPVAGKIINQIPAPGVIGRFENE